jgi:ATP-binding cassette, subfamily C, bacterial exporter for protease/lipase
MNTPISSKRPDELAAAIKSMSGTAWTVAIFSGFLNLLMLAPSLYMLQVYDRVLGSRNETTLIVLTVLIVGAFAFMAALETLRGWILVRVGAKLDAQLSKRVYTASFERNLIKPGSNTSQPMQDLNTLRQTLTGGALLAIFDLPWVPIYLFVIFAFSVPLGFFSLGGVIVISVLALLNERLSKPNLDEAQKYGIQSSLAMTNNLRNAEVIEAMGMLPNIRNRWDKIHQKSLQSQAIASDQASVLGSLTRGVRVTMQSLVLGFGALLVLQGNMTAGMMIAASILVTRALAPAEMLVGNWKQMVSGRAAYARLKEILTIHAPRLSGMALPPPKGNVALEGANAVVPGTRTQVLRGLSFAVKAGEVVAVIGPSASGKSSLARLLVGIWPAISGSVRLDGADIYQWSKDELGPHIGYLPQDIELFDGTVAENIARFGEIDSEKVIAAAKKAGMHELILKMGQGYDTPIGAAGSSLSGGQRQRVGLARALYGDPALVVLDEPNSNLDDVGERALAETIKDLRGMGRTVFLITHRLSTLAVVDKLIVMNEGTIMAFGPRDQVLAALQQKATQMAQPAGQPQPGQARLPDVSASHGSMA